MDNTQIRSQHDEICLFVYFAFRTKCHFDTKIALQELLPRLLSMIHTAWEQDIGLYPDDKLTTNSELVDSPL